MKIKNYWDANKLCEWEMLQKLQVGGFEWFEDKYKFNKDFVKNYNEDSDTGSFLKVGIQYPRKLHKSYNDLPFLPERMKVEKLESLYAV